MIKAIDASQGGLRDECVTDPEHRRSAEPAACGELVEPVGGQAPLAPQDNATPTDIPFLSLEEKRRILARIARVNALDCFDDTGAFDIARAKAVLPPGSIRHIDIHETTRVDAEGQPVTQRHIRLRLVDPLSALRLDDQWERRRERTASSSSSYSESQPDSDSPLPHPASPEWSHYLLRMNTRGLDEANQTLASLKKALDEKLDRQRQLSRELEEKNHQIEAARRARELGLKSIAPQSPDEPQARIKVEESPQGDTDQRVTSPHPQGDTGCQPVNSRQQTPGKSPNIAPHQQLPRRKREFAEASHSMGPGAFVSSAKANPMDPPDYLAGAPRPPPKPA